jgi:3-hydroxyacyl-CoA dehydrogenase
VSQPNTSESGEKASPEGDEAPRALPERLGIAGSGAIACGLARLAGENGGAILWARSEDSAERARERTGGAAEVVTEVEALAESSLIVEAVIEDHAVKADLLAALDRATPEDTILATTTSSLSISELAGECGRPDRFFGLHVFNPVEKMPLAELAFPGEVSDSTRARARALCEALGKEPVEVPDIPGFVVNSLLFPFLFEAVRLMDTHELEPETIDTSMKLGASHPMGPLELLDFVGLDVSVAIGESLGVEVPLRVRALVDQGKLGRKSGAGFYDYS